MISLDANASTTLLPEALEAMLPWLRSASNPSSTTTSGRQARDAIENARSSVADLIGAHPDEIIFTSGGTESVNTAIHSMHQLVGPGHFTISAIEHSAVLQCADHLPRPVSYTPVTATGRIDLEHLSHHLKGCAMLSVMTANNEVGTIQPIHEISQMARLCGIPFHTDAVQAVGKIPVRVRDLGVDLLSLSGHKFHGPKGVGALYVRRGIRFSPLLIGGHQEHGRRAGTENVAAIVGLGVAAQAAQTALNHSPLSAIRDAFETAVLKEIPGTSVNGDLANRLPNTSHLSFSQCEALDLLRLLDAEGIECSAGSSCMSGSIRPSHVQIAMGMTDPHGRSSLRFSFSRFHNIAEAIQATHTLKRIVQAVRSGTALSGTASHSCSLPWS